MKKVICVFCDKKRNKAKEHIWPKWLQIHLTRDTNSNYMGFHMSQFSATVLSQRNQSGESLVFGNICEDCNNGWMSDLESEFKKLFLGIQSDYKKLEKLTKKERLLVSIWGLKTAAMINAGSNYREIVPEYHYKQLYKHRKIPKNVNIDIGFIDSQDKLMWKQSNIPIAIMSKRTARHEYPTDLTENSYIITMQLDKLGIKIIYYSKCKEKGYKIGLSKDNKAVRIWPYSKNEKFKIKNSYDEILGMHLDTFLFK